MRTIFAIISILFLFSFCSCSDMNIDEQKLIGKTKGEIIKYCYEHSLDSATPEINISVVSQNGGTEHLSFKTENEAKNSNQLKETNTWDVLEVKIWGGYSCYRIEFVNDKVFYIKKMTVTDF